MSYKVVDSSNYFDIVEGSEFSPEKRKPRAVLGRGRKRFSKLWPVRAGWERAQSIRQNCRLSIAQMQKTGGASHKFEKKVHGIFIRVGEEFWEFMQNQNKGLTKTERGEVNREALVIGYAELSMREARK